MKNNNQKDLYAPLINEKSSREEVLSAVQTHGSQIKYANNKFKEDREIVINALQNWGRALEHLDEKFKKDKDIVLYSLNAPPYDSLDLADETLKRDKYVVMQAIKNNSVNLLSAHKSFLSDRFLVAMTLNKDEEGECLKYSEINKLYSDDKEIVIIALLNENRDKESYDTEIYKQLKKLTLEELCSLDDDLLFDNAPLLAWASLRLRSDKDVIKIAIRSNPDNLFFIDDKLRLDKEILDLHREILVLRYT